MKPIFVSILFATVIPPLFVPLSPPAQAASPEGVRFACELSGVVIEVARSEEASGPELSARSPKLGELRRVDCAEAGRRFRISGLGGHCFLSEDRRFLFDFEGSPGRAAAGTLRKAGDGFDLCVKQ